MTWIKLISVISGSPGVPACGAEPLTTAGAVVGEGRVPSYPPPPTTILNSSRWDAVGRSDNEGSFNCMTCGDPLAISWSLAAAADLKKTPVLLQFVTACRLSWRIHTRVIWPQPSVYKGLINCKGINQSGPLSDWTVFMARCYQPSNMSLPWDYGPCRHHKAYWILISSCDSIIVEQVQRNKTNGTAGGER